MTGLHHFKVLVRAGGRLYVGGDDRLYAFSFESRYFRLSHTAMPGWSVLAPATRPARTGKVLRS
jgi:hypothetical protein